MCRMCHAEEDDEDAVTLGPLMQVCLCKGSLKHVHHNCLVAWFKSSGERKCPSCQFEVDYTEKLKPWRQWRWSPMTHPEILVGIIQLLLIQAFIQNVYRFLHFVNQHGYSFWSKFRWCHFYCYLGVLLLLTITYFHATVTSSCCKRLLSMNKEIVVKPFRGNRK